MKALYTVVVLLVLSACASIQPAAVQAGDRCVRCRRTIGDVRLAAEIIDQLNAPFPFRTSGCLAKYIKAHPAEKLAGVFVTDYRTGRMLAAADAWFVPVALPQPDGRTSEDDYYAFGSRGDANAFRADRQPLLRWTQVVAAAPAD